MAAPSTTIPALQAQLEARFAARAPQTLEWTSRARSLMPGGVAHDNRFTNAIPLYIESAQGASKRDVDGNSYIDYWVGHGSLLLGHSRPEITAAIWQAAAALTHPGACHPYEVRWAEQIRRLMPHAEQIRFTASGSESTALATRLARATTSRETLLKFDGHFHGWLDHAASGVDLPYEDPWSQGVAKTARGPGGTVCIPADLNRVESELKTGTIAGVILEPTGGAGGAVPVAPEFLRGLRELCTRHGTALIFDEVITGFRVAPGGLQERLGIQADLTCLAKVLAGGMPGGAVTGRKEFFQCMQFSGDGARDRKSRVFQYGTFNAAPVCAAAGTAALELIADGQACRAAEAFTTKLSVSLNDLFRKMDVPLAVYSTSSVFHVFLADAETAVGLRDGKLNALNLDAKLLKKKSPLDAPLRRALQLEGVDLPPGRQAWTSAAHGEVELQETLGAFERALKVLKEVQALA